MKTMLALAALAGALALPSPAHAQVRAAAGVAVTLTLPVHPQLVVVQTGVQVVPDYEEEVFYVSGVYWLRRGSVWYRAPRPTVAFAYVPASRVPVVLTRIGPPGHYRHWKHVPPGHTKARGPSHGQGHGHGHDKHGW